MKNTIKYIKITISVLAILNLAALFLFQYKLPFGGKADEADEAEITADTTDLTWAFQFDTDPLIYDGSEKLNLLDGVSLVDPSGQTSDVEIFVHITTEGSLSSKTIEYSADTDDGRVTATRSMELSNYTGPEITINDGLSTTEITDVNDIAQSLIESGDLKATDGYGSDISDAISATYTRDASTPTLIHCSFTITNIFNDMKSLDIDLTQVLSKPLVVLKDSKITVNKGQSFDPSSMIEAIINTDGTLINDQVEISGTVNVSTPGTYTLTYTAYNYSWIYSDPVTLEVTVTEGE